MLKRLKKRGFTLIELLIVVVIIGILAAIAIPNFIGMVSRAKDAAVKSNMHTLQVTVENVSTMTEGYYPAHLNSSADNIRSGVGLSTVGSGDYTKPISSADATTDPGTNVLLPRNFRNPVKAGNNAHAVTSAFPTWTTSIAGCVFYNPVNADATTAETYKIWGAGAKAMLPDTLTAGQ